MSERKFNLSINKFIIDKPAQYVGINPATDWIPVELTQQQIIEEIQKGYAYTAIFKDNYRKSENFISTDFIAVDIDGGLKIEQILEDNYVKTNCSFVYTTPSHTEINHRFRIVFLLDNTIANKNDWKSALRGIGHKLNGDPSIKDAARMFYGSSKGKFYNFKNILHQNELDQIIDIGKQIKQKIFNENITQQIRLDTKSLMI